MACSRHVLCATYDFFDLSPGSEKLFAIACKNESPTSSSAISSSTIMYAFSLISWSASRFNSLAVSLARSIPAELGLRRVMCGCPRRCKRFLDGGAGDDRVRSCVRPRSAALPPAAGRYGDTQDQAQIKTASGLSSLTLIAFPGLDLSDRFALTAPRPPSSPTHQHKRLPIRPAPALILDSLRPC